MAKAFLALEYMANSDHSSETLGEIAAGLGLSSSTLHRVLGLLENEGMVQQDANRGRYSIGPKFLHIARLATTKRSIAEVVRPWLGELRNQTGETAWYGEYEPATHSMRFIETAESHHSLRHVRELNVSISIFTAGAAGRVVLAFLPRDQQAILQNSPEATNANPSFTDDTQLDAIRKSGFAISRSDRSGVGIAAPVVDRRGRLMGVVGIGYPSTRHDDDEYAELVASVRASASRISEELHQASDVFRSAS